MQVRTEKRYHGLVQTVLTVWKASVCSNSLLTVSHLSLQQRGLPGFFDGASLRLSRKVLSSAIGWAVYEGVLMLMRQSDKQRRTFDS